MRRQRLERPAARREETDEELEQDQARGLDADHEALERDDRGVADDQHRPVPRARRFGHADDGGAQAAMRQRECADAHERDRVHRELQHVLDDFTGGRAERGRTVLRGDGARRRSSDQAMPIGSNHSVRASKPAHTTPR